MAYHSYFSSSHITYENFAIESMLVNSQGQVAFGRNTTYTIPANAELMAGAALFISLPALTAPIIGGAQYNIAWCHSLGFYIFTKLEFRAQSQILDTQHPEYMDAWSRLSISASQREGYNDMIGEVNFISELSTTGSLMAPNYLQYPQAPVTLKPAFNILVPLNFWWCNDYTQSIPIGVLLYTTLKLLVYFNNVTNLYVLTDNTGNFNQAGVLTTQPALVDCQLWVDYVFLDEAARNRIARDAHFFVFKQTQTNGIQTVSTVTAQARLQFVLPVLHLMTFVREQSVYANGVNGPQRWGWVDKFANNPSLLPRSPFLTIEIRINSQRRMEQRDYLYHARYQPFKAHTSIPRSRGIWIFSFALFPEEADASGDCNFSRAENNLINYTFDTTTQYNDVGGLTPMSGIGVNGIIGDLFVYATNYNYIFIEAGLTSGAQNRYLRGIPSRQIETY